MLNIHYPLMVGSVFVSGERTKTWYDLQMQFLQKTTKNFQHVVFLNGSVDESIFTRSIIIGRNKFDCIDGVGEDQSKNHLIGLQAILHYFQKQSSQHFLFLDADCFPISQNWDSQLQSLMNLKNKSFAAPIRAENYDTFPHPSALFATKEALNSKWFDLSCGHGSNLVGRNLNDVGVKLPIQHCYPIMRSNSFNAHPIFGGIYGHMFYHHACGTRPKTILTRGIQDTSAFYINNHWEIEENIFNKLKENPESVINKFLGNYSKNNI